MDTRVLVASAHPPVRRLLMDMVEGEPGFCVVGEASSEVEARALARHLAPEAALVDFHLPHAIGLESVRLSRMSGLDAAMAIADESQGTRVVLLTNLDAAIFRGKGLVRGIARRLLTEIGGIRRALTLRELYLEEPQAASPVFAHVEVTEARTGGRRAASRALRGTALVAAGVVVLFPVISLVALLIGAIALAITQ